KFPIGLENYYYSSATSKIDNIISVTSSKLVLIGETSSANTEKRYIDDLNSPDWLTRANAVHALGQNIGENNFSIIANMLNDPAIGVRDEALSALYKSKNPLVIVVVSPLLRDKEEDVRVNALHVIGNFGENHGFDLMNYTFDP